MPSGCGGTVDGLTTPHKLQAEARSRKRGRQRLGVYPLSKPMAEACQLHAVVRLILRPPARRALPATASGLQRIVTVSPLVVISNGGKVARVIERVARRRYRPGDGVGRPKVTVSLGMTVWPATGHLAGASEVAGERPGPGASTGATPHELTVRGVSA